MRSASLLGLLLLPTLFAVPATAVDSVSVHLLVDASITAPYNEPAFTAECDVTVDAGSDAGAVLDAAVANGCIDDWDYTTHPTFGRFVTAFTADGGSAATDGRNTDNVRFACGASPPNPGGPLLFSSWGFGLNGGASPTGIDDYSASADDALSFHYLVDSCTFAVTLAFAFTGIAPSSPVPLAGTALTDPGGV